MAQVDTVGEYYYKPAQWSETIGDVLFWFILIMSVAAFFVGEGSYPLSADILQIALIICVVLFFIQGLVQRLYLFPRAEDKRRQELLSDSFGVPLTHEKTVGYYNNNQTSPIKRLAASVMESAFFTCNISKMMLTAQRAKTGSYIALYAVTVLNRSTDLELLAIVAQGVFGSDIIARWLRLEWLRFRSEQAFDNFNRLFRSRPAFGGNAAQAEALDLFTFYETTKSTAALILSSKVFDKHNPRLTEEWVRIRSRLGL
jgi:hypothetical protein